MAYNDVRILTQMMQFTYLCLMFFFLKDIMTHLLSLGYCLLELMIKSSIYFFKVKNAYGLVLYFHFHVSKWKFV